jgi:hypothetical protein
VRRFGRLMVVINSTRVAYEHSPIRFVRGSVSRLTARGRSFRLQLVIRETDSSRGCDAGEDDRGEISREARKMYRALRAGDSESMAEIIERICYPRRTQIDNETATVDQGTEWDFGETRT